MSYVVHICETSLLPAIVEMEDMWEAQTANDDGLEVFETKEAAFKEARQYIKYEIGILKGIRKANKFTVYEKQALSTD